MEISKPKRKYYVVHYLDNGEQYTEEIEDRYVRCVTPREDAHAFIMLGYITADVKDGDNTIILYSNPVWQSGVFYTKGEKLSLRDIGLSDPDNTEIIEKMKRVEEITGEKAYVVRFQGEYFIFRKQDKMFDSSKVRRK